MDIKIDYDSLKRAIKQNPKRVAQETKNFLYKAEKRLEAKTGQSPWRVGGSGGGSPVDTGNLLRSHRAKRDPFKLTWYVDQNKAPYAKYVHGIKGRKRKRSYKLRPWLDWVEKQSKPIINRDAEQLLKNVTNHLGDK